MIIIERHENMDNWIEVKFYGKLLDQFTSKVQAYKFAQQQAKKLKAKIYDWDKGAIKEREE
tara:strand:- start:682 stop:864 length:183 start_codon:yes stop_codon:yes gene_type:complete